MSFMDPTTAILTWFGGPSTLMWFTGARGVGKRILEDTTITSLTTHMGTNRNGNNNQQQGDNMRFRRDQFRSGDKVIIKRGIFTGQVGVVIETGQNTHGKFFEVKLPPYADTVWCFDGEIEGVSLLRSAPDDRFPIGSCVKYAGEVGTVVQADERQRKVHFEHAVSFRGDYLAELWLFPESLTEVPLLAYKVDDRVIFNGVEGTVMNVRAAYPLEAGEVYVVFDDLVKHSGIESSVWWLRPSELAHLGRHVNFKIGDTVRVDKQGNDHHGFVGTIQNTGNENGLTEVFAYHPRAARLHLPLSYFVHSEE